MRLFVTGCSGFVGGSLGRFASACGHEVLGLSRSHQVPPGWTGRHVTADVSQADLAAVVSDFRPDAVFHGAGSASVAGSVSAPTDDFRASVGSWVNLLDAVRRSGLAPVVAFPSSAAVYGNPAALPVDERAAIDPISPYGFHKAACELLAREYAQCFGLRTLVVRIFSLFGPAQHRLLLWELYSQAAGAAAEIGVAGTGRETRDYLHVDDFSRLTLALLSAGSTGTVNVASGSECSVMSLCECIQGHLGTRKPVRCGGRTQPGDPSRWRADTAVLAARLGRPAADVPPLDESVGRCLRSWADAGHGPPPSGPLARYSERGLG